MRPGQIKNRTQLLVEGKDALNFFAAFAKHLTLTGIQIQDFGGVNDLGDFLEAFSTAPGFHKVDSVGIVRDAEKPDETSVTGTRDAERGAPLRREATRAAESAFQSVCTALGNAGLPVPRSAIEKTVSRPVVSVLILPGSREDGMLETLLCSRPAVRSSRESRNDTSSGQKRCPPESQKRASRRSASRGEAETVG